MDDSNQTPVIDNAQSFSFKAETKQLLNILIHSLYKEKDVFLRELLSNASDALNRFRFEMLTTQVVLDANTELCIRVSADKDTRMLTIQDTGIGMNRSEMIENLGTIAQSGARKFLEVAKDQKGDFSQVIGQFGVGFYSAFIVADRITVDTRRAGLPAKDGVRWESDGSGEFTVESIDRPQRGTSITMHLREGEDDFLSSY